MGAHPGEVGEGHLTQPARDREFEQHVTLGFGESIEMDVRFCDLVAGRTAGTFDVRFRGYRAGTQERIRFYADLEMIEGALVHEGVLRQSITPPAKMDERTAVEIKLEKYALAIARQRRGNGSWRYLVTARDQSDVKQWTRAIAEAADTVAPELTSRGYAVGSSEIITIAGALVRRRSHQQ